MAEGSDNPASEASSIYKDGLDIWLTQGRTWFERSKDSTTWSPEDVVGDTTNLVEHLTPLVQRSIDLGIELLRPWAQAIQERSS